MADLQQQAQDRAYPFVSVVVPVRNEADCIANSLQAIFKQDYPRDRFEIIMVDGLSTDNTRQIAATLAAGQPVRFTLLKNKRRITPAAMNIGIAASLGEIILRVDGHAVLRPDYIRRCIELLRNSDAACVGGIIESKGNGYMGTAIALAMSSTFGVGGSGFRTASADSQPRETDTVPFGAYRKSMLDKIGPFNEQMIRHQDYEFNYRLRQAGGKIILLPTAGAAYYVRASLGNLLQQYWQYGIYKGRFLKTHPNSLRFRHLIPPLFVFALLASGLGALFSKMSLTIAIALLILYSLFGIVALLSFAIRKKFAFLPVLPVILTCLHLSWGTGLLTGLLLQPKINNGQPQSHDRSPDDFHG